jgi:hypothetical protein
MFGRSAKLWIPFPAVDELRFGGDDRQSLRFCCGFQEEGFAMSSKGDRNETSPESESKELYKKVDESKLDLRSSDDLRSRRLDRNEAKKLIQRAHEISYIKHCRDELANDKLCITDVPNVLRCGKIFQQPEEKFGAWRYVVETDHMAVTVEIVSETSVRAITAWRK